MPPKTKYRKRNQCTSQRKPRKLPIKGKRAGYTTANAYKITPAMQSRIDFGVKEALNATNLTLDGLKSVTGVSCILQQQPSFIPEPSHY
ncbi:hypothetical protein BCR33DRAFT_791680 [Rhizoclosmatium globosum]|uniref:Uncharacterized protein n=1 Tax=Rhizoclosmatium globosum TaxID=329046 RepID=A0A1Y2BCA9_9FUNG|nr:hypothetical protein BCR33DRAFT_791680 [Rhizoclosmatium globosum]|eukprot:ORY32394.1 hypothetical protein BCR33DRAFT_791680 [Rhizoclosmatium globosum]